MPMIAAGYPTFVPGTMPNTATEKALVNARRDAAALNSRIIGG